jgi:hypothetical protein
MLPKSCPSYSHEKQRETTDQRTNVQNIQKWLILWGNMEQYAATEMRP